MRLKDFRVGWRALVREPGYSLVVVLGLAAGLAACLLLLGFVRYSYQYDSHVPDVDNVYVIKQRYNVDSASPWFDFTPYVLRSAAMNAPGVIEASGAVPWAPYPVRVGNNLYRVFGYPVFPHFAKMLGVRAVEGDVDAALDQPGNFAITEKTAARIFGTSHALGRTVQVNGKILKVAAILRDPPATTTFPFEALMGVNSILIPDEFRQEVLTGSGAGMGKLLIRVRPGSSISAITEVLQKAVDESPGVALHASPTVRERLGKRKIMDIQLAPLRDAYFDRDIATNPITAPGDRGDPAVIAGLAAIAVLILALAAVNYVNLATVRMLQRQREIGMRKVLGAGAWRIALQFLAESILVAMLATVLGLLLAWLMLPVFSELMNRKLESMVSFSNLLASLGIGLSLGALSAAYPAWIALRVRPSQVLAGRAGSESARSRKVRLVMTVLQVSVAMGLAGVTLAVAWQTHFALNVSPGFDPKPLLIVDLPERVKESEKARGFMNALAQQDSIAGVTVSADAVGRFTNPWGVDLKREGGQPIFVDMKSVGANFFEQYRIQPVAGRLFDPRLDREDDPEPIVINMVAVRVYGFASPEAALGQTLHYLQDGKPATKRIIGIAPDLRFYSLHTAPRATAYELWTLGTTLSVRARGSLRDAERSVRELWPRYFPDALLELHTAEEILSGNYADEARIARLLVLATGLALAIAAFGTYVLSAHTVQRRAKEIVLRKLHGARRRNVASLVLKDAGTLMLLAAVVGLPPAAVLIQRYLAAYVEHAPIGYWTLLFALGSTLLVVLVAAARHARIAMNMPPADALRA